MYYQWSVGNKQENKNKVESKNHPLCLEAWNAEGKPSSQVRRELQREGGGLLSRKLRAEAFGPWGTIEGLRRCVSCGVRLVWVLGAWNMKWAGGHTGKSKPVQEDVGGEAGTQKRPGIPEGRAVWALRGSEAEASMRNALFSICVSQPSSLLLHLCSAPAFLPQKSSRHSKK